MFESCQRAWPRFVVAAAMLVSLPGLAAAQPRPWQPVPRYELRTPPVALADRALERALAARKPGEPGVAIALMLDGKCVLTRYSGVESLERDTRIDERTSFYIASVAKTITATAALMLWERGAIRLEDSLGRWLDQVPACARGVRILHLLQHTSGIPDHMKALGDSVKGLDNARVVQFVRDLRALDFGPGERYAYSNTGYILLAEIIGKASKRDYAAFVQDSILRPLGMTRTTLVRMGMPEIDRRATGYRRDKDRFEIDDVQDRWTLGSGGMYSTLSDMITWYQAVVGSKLLKPSSTALLFDTPVTLSGRKSYLGMGWSDETPGARTPEIEGLRAYGSFGELAGFRAAMLFYPDHKMAWIALSNAGEGEFPPEGMISGMFRRVP